MHSHQLNYFRKSASVSPASLVNMIAKIFKAACSETEAPHVIQLLDKIIIDYLNFSE